MASRVFIKKKNNSAAPIGRVVVMSMHIVTQKPWVGLHKPDSLRRHLRAMRIAGFNPRRKVPHEDAGNIVNEPVTDASPELAQFVGHDWAF